MYVIYKCIKYCILFIIIYDHLYIISKYHDYHKAFDISNT